MNKVFLGIILAVCILGMILVLLNNRLVRKPEPRSNTPVAEKTLPRSQAEMEAAARALEIAEADRALAGPEQARQIERKQDLQPEIAPPAEIRPIIEPAPAIIPEPEATQPPATIPLPEVAQPKPQSPAPKPQASAQEAPAAKPKPEETAPPKATGAKTINRFVVYARDKGATVRIGGNAKLDYSSMTLEDPNRVVVDLGGSWKFPPNPGIPKNELVSAVRVGQSGDKARIVIDLKAKPRKVVLVPFKNGDGVDVRVDK